MMFHGVLSDYVRKWIYNDVSGGTFGLCLKMDILVKREVAKRMLSPSQVEFTPVELNYLYFNYLL